MKKRVLSQALIATLCVGCHTLKTMNTSDPTSSIARHAVMTAGQEVVFENPNGSGRIDYLSEFSRRYVIDGQNHDVKLVQRPKQWRHQNGIYNPGESWGPLSLDDGIAARFVVEESELRFSTNEECDGFFKEGASYAKWVSGDHGLVLGFSSSPARDQINVSLYRCFISGKPMKDLPAEYKHAGFVRLR